MKMTKVAGRTWTCLCFLAMIAHAGACGDVTGGRGDPPDGGTSLPVADGGAPAHATAVITAPETANVFEEVTLDAQRSFASPGQVLTDYSWALLERPATSSAALREITRPQAFFTPDAAGTYRVRLGVYMGEQGSDFAEASLEVSDACCRPIANAGGARSVSRTGAVTLDGTQSRDPRNQMLTYRWRLLDAPDGGAATLAPLEAPRPVFRPDPARPHARYRAELVVSNGRLESAPAVAEVDVENAVPTATLGDARAARPGDSIPLALTAADADGDPLLYAWSVVSPPESMGALFVAAPPIAAQLATRAGYLGDYVVQCQVSDGFGGTATAQVTVSMVNSPPTVQLPTPAPVAHTCTASGSCSATVSLSATATDPDGDAMTFSWAKLAGPSASVSFGNPTARDTSLQLESATGAIGGTYAIQFCARDALHQEPAACATAQVVVLNRAPTVTTTAPARVEHLGPLAPSANGDYLSQVIELRASGLDAEYSQTIAANYLQYTWRVVSKADPLATVEVVDDSMLNRGTYSVRVRKRCQPASACQPTPGLLGTYVFEVEARDPSGGTGTAQATVLVGNRAPLRRTAATDGLSAGMSGTANHQFVGGSYLSRVAPIDQAPGVDLDGDPLDHVWCVGNPGAGLCVQSDSAISLADTPRTVPAEIVLRASSPAILGPHTACVIASDPWDYRAISCVDISVQNRAPLAPTSLALTLASIPHQYANGVTTATIPQASPTLAAPADLDLDPISSHEWTLQLLDTRDPVPTITGPAPNSSGPVLISWTAPYTQLSDSLYLCLSVTDTLAATSGATCQPIDITNQAPILTVGLTETSSTRSCNRRIQPLSGCTICNAVTTTSLHTVVGDPNGDPVIVRFACAAIEGFCDTMPAQRSCASPPCAYDDALRCIPNPSSSVGRCSFSATVEDSYGLTTTASVNHVFTCSGTCTTQCQ